MTKNKIYVHVIGGSESWIPINARQIQEDQYEILNDNEYDLLETSELFEFLPGDIVTVDEKIFLNGETHQVAKKLIKPSSRQDRKYWEFMFLSITNRFKIHTDTYFYYQVEIEQIKKSTDQFIYPAVVKAIEGLDQRLIMTKQKNK